MNPLKIGALFRTSYGTGPYRITHISGPSTKPPLVAIINNLGREDQLPPAAPHYHITAVWAGAVLPGRKPPLENSYFNGYGADGKNVFRDDALIFEGYAPGTIDDLFGAEA